MRGIATALVFARRPLQRAAIQFQPDLAILQQLAQGRQLDLYDRRHVRPLQAAEQDHLVQPVQELGPEGGRFTLRLRRQDGAAQMSSPMSVRTIALFGFHWPAGVLCSMPDIEPLWRERYSRTQEFALMTIIRQPDVLPGKHRESRAADPVARFVRGEISRGQAMAELGGISYAALIERVAERGLRLPSLPNSALIRMADDMVHVLDTSA